MCWARMSDDDFPDFDDDDVPPPQMSETVISFFEAKRKFDAARQAAAQKRRQGDVLRARVQGIQKKERRLKRSIEEQQAVATRWAERYASAADDAARARLFNDELAKAIANGDDDIVAMLKEHARAERRRINQVAE